MLRWMRNIYWQVLMSILYTPTLNSNMQLKQSFGLSIVPISRKKNEDFLVQALDLAMSHNFFWHDKQYFRQKKGVTMGAKYAPKWLICSWATGRKKQFFNNTPSSKLYEDDIIIIWAGTQDFVLQFLTEIGNNRYSISFTATFERQYVNLLDFIIFKEKHQLFTKTHFKEVDIKGYIPLGSCHHPRQLSAIPKSQFMRVKRNCIKKDDYDIHRPRFYLIDLRKKVTALRI